MEIFKNIFYKNKLIISTIIILILIIPLINDNTFPNSTIVSKTFFFIYFVIASLVIAIISFLFFKQGKILINISKIDIFLFILISFISINRLVIQSHFGFSIRYIELIGLTFLYLILRIQSSKNYIWFLLAIIASGIVQVVLGTLQLLGIYASNHSEFNLTGGFSNPGPYAGFLAAIFPIALGTYLFKDKIITLNDKYVKNKSITTSTINYVLEYFPLLGIIGIVLVLPATHSRAAWLSVFFSSVVLMEKKYSILSKFLKRISFGQSVFLITSILCLIATGLFGIYNFKKNSSDGRLFIWNNTLDIIEENPVFGIGFDRFKSHYMNYQANYFSRNGENAEVLVADNTYYAFNEWLQFIAENGFIGLVLLGILIYCIFKLNLKKEFHHIYVPLLNGLFSIGIFAFFSYPMQILPIKLILVILVALLANLDVRKYTYTKKVNLFTFKLLKVAICTVTLMALTRGILYTKNLEQNFKTLQNALDSYMYGNYQSAINNYKSLYNVFKKEGDFLMNYGKALSANKQKRQAIEILLEAKQYVNNTLIETTLGNTYKDLKRFDKAEKSYKKAANMIPSRFHPMYLLAKLYDYMGERGQAIIMAKTILDKEIKVSSTTIEEMKADMNKMINKYKLLDIQPFRSNSSYISKLNKALDLANENKVELLKVLNHYKSPKDSLKLEAAEFLISNMAHHGSRGIDTFYDQVCNVVEKERIRFIKKYPKSNPWIIRNNSIKVFEETEDSLKKAISYAKNKFIPDLKQIKSEYIIENIDLAFKTYEKKHLNLCSSKKDFFRYILPYRSNDEPLVDGRRKRLYEKYKWIHDSLKTQPLDSVVKSLSISLDITAVFGDENPFKNTPSIEQIEKTHFGNCLSLANYMVNILRAVGIPAGIDSNLRWGDYHKSMGHVWVFYLNKDKFVPINIGLGDKFETLQELYRFSSLTKVYRLSFDSKKDITHQYKKTYNFQIPIIWENTNPKTENIFLAVFDKKLGWDKIQVADSLSNKNAFFNNVCANIVYLPVTYDQNKITPINYPFELQFDGTIKYFKINDNEKIKRAQITRKYPPFFTRTKKEKIKWAKSLNDCKIQGSNSNYEDSYQDLHEFKSYNSLNQQKIFFPRTYNYTHYRLKTPQNKNINISRFILINEKGHPIYEWDKATIPDIEKSNIYKITDSLPLTFIEKKGFQMTYTFKEPTKVGGIIVQTRNDDNNVVNGDFYELMLWNKDWVSLGRKKAKDTLLTYNELHKDGLYWIKNLTKGNEEFIFSFDDSGKQFWTGVSEYESVNLGLD